MATNQNQTIVTLYQSLCDQQNALSAAIQSTTDPNLADALSTENYEVMHRIVLAQNLLLQSDSAALQKCVKAVSDASAQLQTSIAQVTNATSIIKSVSSYLALVDKAIDLAKTLAPLAA